MTRRSLIFAIAQDLTILRGFLKSIEASIDDRIRLLGEETQKKLPQNARRDAYAFWEYAPPELGQLVDEYRMMYRRAGLVFLLSYFEMFLRRIAFAGSVLLEKPEYRLAERGSEMGLFHEHWVDVLELKAVNGNRAWGEIRNVVEIRNRIVHQSGTVGRLPKRGSPRNYSRMKEWYVPPTTRRYIRRHPHLAVGWLGRIDLTAEYLPGLLRVIEKLLEKLVLELPEDD